MPSLLDKAPRLSISIVIWILSSDTVTICQFNQLHTNSEAAMLSSLCPPRRCCPPSLPPTSAYSDVHHSTYSGWEVESKDGILRCWQCYVLLTIGTLTLFLLKFFMKQTDGALKQDCRGVNNKNHAAEGWDLEFVFQTPQKVFSNTTKKLFIKNHIIRFPSVQSNILVGFKISLSRESTIFRNEIEVFFFLLSPGETRSRLS